MDGDKHRQTDRQTDRHTYTQIGTDKHTPTHIHIHTYTVWKFIVLCICCKIYLFVILLGTFPTIMVYTIANTDHGK